MRLISRHLSRRLFSRCCKPVISAEEAVSQIRSGSVVLVGGFGLCGLPEKLLGALSKFPVDNLTIVGNDSGQSMLQVTHF